MHSDEILDSGVETIAVPGSCSLTKESEMHDGKWATPTNNNAGDSVSSAEEAANERMKEVAHASCEAMVEPQHRDCHTKLNHCNCPEKTVYMVSIATMVVVCTSMVAYRWFFPYLYTGLLAVLLPFRMWKYSQLKWQFFLFDWCYVTNVLNLLFLWAVPFNSVFFMVVFGLSNGPVTWAIVLFRNCLVPHSVERMTCLVIHLMPGLVSYLVRWHPADTSLYWYRDFADLSLLNITLQWEFLWLILLPLACYICHLLIYLALFVWLLGKSDYLNNYTYLVHHGDGVISRTIKCKGGKFKMGVYVMLQFAFACLTITLSWLWFTFKVAHIVYLCAIFMVATYHGSTYYLDLYPKRALDSDPYRMCGKV